MFSRRELYHYMTTCDLWLNLKFEVQVSSSLSQLLMSPRVIHLPACLSLKTLLGVVQAVCQ